MAALAPRLDASLSSVSSNPVADSFLACLARAKHETWPFDYWLLENAIPDADVDAITGLPFAPPPDAVFNGRRETNNATRVYFTPENQVRFRVCRDIVRGFEDPLVRKVIEKTTGTDLAGARLRIEYSQDEPGFWLEPHTDLGVKKFTCLIYLSEGHDDLGTDIYADRDTHSGVTPFAPNSAMVFVPSDRTWHGFEKRPIRGVRKSVILNYVTHDWRAREQLSFPGAPVRV